MSCIPIRCFTCGNIIADKYRLYLEKVKTIKLNKINQDNNNIEDINNVCYLSETNIEKTPEGLVLDELKIKNVCCRRHMLTHVDII